MALNIYVRTVASPRDRFPYMKGAEWLCCQPRGECGDHVGPSRYEAGDAADEINEAFDLAASEKFPAIAIFPAIRTEARLVDQLQLLASGKRWTLTREVVQGLVTDDVLLGLQWRTPTGLHSLPMGFAPFATMPVTRRAPYVCLATGKPAGLGVVALRHASAHCGSHVEPESIPCSALVRRKRAEVI